MKRKQNTSYGNTNPIKPLWGFNYVAPYFCNLVSIKKLINGQQAIYLIFKYILQKFTCKFKLWLFSSFQMYWTIPQTLRKKLTLTSKKKSNGDLSLATLAASFVILVLHYVYKNCHTMQKKNAFLIKTDANLSKTVSDSPEHVLQTIYNRLIKSETLSVFLFFFTKRNPNTVIDVSVLVPFHYLQFWLLQRRYLIESSLVV